MLRAKHLFKGHFGGLFFITTLLSALFLGGCAGTDTVLREKSALAFQQGDLVGAEREAINPKLISEFQNRLLSLLDLGAIAHYAGQFEKSNVYFFKAKDVAKQLYTTSIREQIATGLLNDNSASYVGMEYEISLVHYFIASNFIFLSQEDKIPAWQIPEIRDKKDLVLAGKSVAERTQTPKEKQEWIGRARAELLDWNAYLREVREKNLGQPYYKDDLLNKVFAAYIHRLVGSMQDQNIAQILLKDADEILVKAYAAYPSFNGISENYVENYNKFSNLGVETVRNKYIQSTPYLDVTKDLIQRSSKEPGNLLYVLEYGMNPRRVEKNYVIGLTTLFKEIKDPVLRRQVEEIGTHVLIQLAPQFGLTVFGAALVGATTGSNADGEKPKYLSEAVDAAIGFQFKLPAIPNDPVTETYVLKFIGADGKETSANVALMNPLTDIARLNVDRRADAVAFKTGVRVGLKYLAALVPAILTYKKVNGPDFVKMVASTAVWMAGKRIVDFTEAADLRAWNLLPKWIGLAELKLPVGSYRVVATRTSDGKTRELSPIKIKTANQKVIFKSRIISDGASLDFPALSLQ